MNDIVTTKPAAIGWEPELAELRQRQALAREMGGKDRVERQHTGGRLTVRERIDRLLDEGTFKEIGSIAGKAWYDAEGNITEFMPGNCVFGRGMVDGRPVVVAATTSPCAAVRRMPRSRASRRCPSSSRLGFACRSFG
jgi:acetyl-CoA carboxylase carboxyltransferase component